MESFGTEKDSGYLKKAGEHKVDNPGSWHAGRAIGRREIHNMFFTDATDTDANGGSFRTPFGRGLKRFAWTFTSV